MQKIASDAAAVEVGGSQFSLQRSRLAFCGRVLTLDAGDEDAAHVLATTYGTVERAPERGAHHTAFVRRLGDGRLHVRFDRTTLAAGERPGAPGILPSYYALKEIFARFAASVPGAVAFYSALVEVNGAGVLIAGPASAGKTLLALHLHDRGARFLGDETAVLDVRSARVRALPRRPSLRESALAYVPAKMRDSIAACQWTTNLNGSRFWYALDEDALGGITPRGYEVALGAIILVRDRTSEPSLTPIDRVQALPMLLQRAYSRPFQLLEISAIRRAMRHVQCFELFAGEPAATADLILRKVRQCA